MSAPRSTKLKLSDYDFNDLHEYPNVGFDKSGAITEFAYDGNTLIRPAGVKLPFTEDTLKEIEKCKKDKFYFYENYCYIQTLDHGKIIPELRDYQKEFLDIIDNNRRIIGKLARQSGKTVSNALYITWCLVFEKDYTVGIVANTADLTAEIVAMVKEIFELLPPWLQVGVKKWNTKSILLENGNKILSAVAGPSALRGRSISYLLIDEAAWIDEKKMNGFLDSVMPALSSGKNTKICIISTPNGYNRFHKYWKEAIEGLSSYVPFEVNWRQVPGRDEEWKRQQIEDDGPLSFAQNHEISFIGSSATLLTPESLAELSKKAPLEEDALGIPNFNIYEDYDPKYTYLIGIDSSKTVGKLDAKNDYICINVLKLDLKNRKITQAATYRTNEIHYRDIAEVGAQIGEHYGHSMIVVENNEGAGTHAAEKLMEEYDFIYYDPNHNGEVPGIRTTKKTKSIGLSNIKKFMDSGILDVIDSKSIDEFFTFIKVGKSYAASSGETDDCIMSLSTTLLPLVDVTNPIGITLDDFLVDSGIEDNTEDNSLNFTDILYGDKNTSIEDMKWLLGVS